MAHELSVAADGRASMAYTGQTPWHGLGQVLQPGADLLTWQQQAGLDWTAKMAGVRFGREFTGVTGADETAFVHAKGHKVIYRSDTGDVLSIVSDKYKPVQPKEVIEFYRDLTEKHGFELETAGSLKDGKRIWALANTRKVTKLRGNDEIRGYLLLATSYDGTMATQARFTSVRVVCNNTLEFATQGARADVTVPHSTTFDADKVKLDLKVGDAWEKFSLQANDMTTRLVSKDEQMRFFLDVYYGLDTDEKIREAQADESKTKSLEKFMGRMTHALFNSPGAQMESARGLLWGLVNAVTYDVDFNKPARTQENRLNAAWFGEGASIKQRAWDRALTMVA